ncbi:MAG: hypothetical protein R3Y06_05805 [Faecalibacterium sp.]
MKKTTYSLVIILGGAFIVLSALPFFLAGTSAIFAAALLEGFLSYYGAILSALGTIALGFIAVYQNKKLTRLQEQVQSTTQSCNIYLTTPKNNLDLDNIKELKNNNKTDAASDLYLVLSLENFSDAFLKSIEITFPTQRADTSSICYHVHTSFITLVKGRKKYYSLNLPAALKINGRFAIKFTSCYDVVTYGDFQIDLLALLDPSDPCEIDANYDPYDPNTIIDLDNTQLYYKPKHFNFYGTAAPTEQNTSI